MFCFSNYKDITKAIVCLAFLCITNRAAAQDLQRKVSFTCPDCTISQAAQLLKSKTGIAFSYSNIDVYPRRNFEYKDETVTSILNDLVKGTYLKYASIPTGVRIYDDRKIYTLSGYVTDSLTTDILIGATVRVKSVGLDINQKARVPKTTNNFGSFTMDLPAGVYDIFIKQVGYLDLVKRITLHQDNDYTYQMTSRTLLGEVVIEDSQKFQRRKNGSIPISPKRNHVSPIGQGDIFKVAALEPGIQTGVDGIGGLSVRGGQGDQNLILLDDVPIYNPYHAFGVASIFNLKSIAKTDLWKGDFPARYGGRTASVIDIRTSDGDMKKWGGSVSTDMLLSSIGIEGPFVKDKISFLAEFRHTHIGYLRNLFPKRDSTFGVNTDLLKYRFYDMNVKLKYKLPKKHTLYLSFYNGGDRIYTPFSQVSQSSLGEIKDSSLIEGKWGNTIASFRWNWEPKDKFFVNTTARYSLFQYESEVERSSELFASNGRKLLLADYLQFYQTKIEDWSLKTDVIYSQSNTLDIYTGASFTLHNFNPGTIAVNFDAPGQSEFSKDSLSRILENSDQLTAFEAVLYADFEWDIIPQWRLDGGINLSNFRTFGQKNYWLILPRLRLQHNGKKQWNQWMSITSMGQNLHQIGSLNLSLPFELWVPSTNKVRPEHALQFTLGHGWSIDKKWFFENEVYYKYNSRMLTLLTTGDAFVNGGTEDASGWEDRVIEGEGWSRGLELSVKHQWNEKGLFFVNYTWSKTDRKFEDLNAGEVFPYRFDRRHLVNLGAQIAFPAPRLVVGINWMYGTGNPITLAGQRYIYYDPTLEIPPQVVYDYPAVNGYRLPDIHRLDVSLQYRFRQKRYCSQELELKIYNAYNRANPFYITVESSGLDKNRPVQYTLLPIWPTLRYEIRF